MSNKSAIARLSGITGTFILPSCLAAFALFCMAGIASAADIKVVPSAFKVTPGESFYADVVVEGIPAEGLGAIQFRLNVSAPGSTVASVSDTAQGQPGDVSVSSPLIVGPATTSRSGIGDFFWNSKGSHGILVMDNEIMLNGSALYTLGQTNGAALPSGSGSIARFQINAGSQAAAEKIIISLVDVALLEGSTVYPIENNTGATVDLKCYTQVPDLIGLSGAEATTALTTAKLSPGTTYEIDNSAAGTHALNAVLVQSVNPGTTLLCETAVDLAINTAPSEVTNIHAVDKTGDESGTAVLSWNPSLSSDTAGYRVYNASGIRVSDIANAASTGVEMSGLALGQASSVSITAYDTHGNESTGVVVSAAAVDDVAPRITVSGVSNNAYYRSDVQPVITVQDANLALNEITLNGVSYAQLPVSAEGTYLLRVLATDTAGNSNMKEITFTVDKTPPAISVAGIAKDMYYNMDLSPAISVTDADLEKVETFLNGNAYTSGTLITTENNYELRIQAQDKAGNSSSDTYAFFIDKTRPTSTMTIGSPKFENNGLQYVAGATPLTLAGSDPGTIVSGVNKLEYRTNDAVWNVYQAPIALAGLSDGPVTMDYRAVDRATNTEEFNSLAVTLDTTVPVSTLSIGQPNYIDAAGTVYIGQITSITLSAADALSGVALTEYKLDADAWINNALLTISGEGSHTMLYHSKDNVANLEPDKTLTAIVDNTSPVTTIATSGSQFATAEGSLYVTGSTTFTLVATDNLSGIAATEYRIDGGAWTTYALFTIAAEGLHTIDYYSKDNVLNTETFKTFTAIVDNAAPVTAITTSEPKFASTDGKLYVTGSTTFTLAATDNAAGVALTEYRIDGGAWTSYAPFVLAAEGQHTIDYYSKDNVANTETFKTLMVIVDTIPPVTTITTGDPKYTAADGKLYVTGSTMLTLSATDNLSGVALTQYRIDGGAWTLYVPFALVAEGTHTVDYRSQDNVTTLETLKTLAVIVDSTPPVTTITTGDPKYTSADGKLYVTSGTTFTLAATDNLSGIEKTEYRIDGGAWTTYAPFTMAGEGQHTIDYYSKDNVANTETFKMLTVIVDSTPPVTTITTGEPKFASTDGKLYVTSGTTFTLAATDNLSGIEMTEYRIDGGAWTTYAPFTMAGEGQHTIDYYSKDSVTNTEAVKTLVVITDNTVPASTLAIGSPQYQSDGKLYVGGGTGITITASDTVSGVKKTEFSIDGGEWNVYTTVFTLSSYDDGAHTIRYRSTDNVANGEEAKELAVILDKTPPQTAISASDPLFDGITNTISPSTFLTMSAGDALSGVKTISFRINNGAWEAYTGSFSLTGMTAGQYIIGYRATDNVLNEETEKTITLRLIIMEVEKKIAADSIILVGVENDNSDLDRKQADIQMLSKLLTSLNVTYTVAETTEDFTTALRSGRYNTYVLIDVKDPLIGEEVRESVFSGDGLIFIKTQPNADPFLDDTFGLKFSGRTTSDNLTITLLESPISTEGTLQTIGKSVVSTLTSTTAQVYGSVVDKKEVYPAVIFNQYERGKVLLYTFDLLNAGDQPLASALLIESINFVRPTEQTPRALGSAPVRITVTNSTEPVEMKVIETLPYGATVDTVVPRVTPVDDTLTWRKSMAASERAGFGYYLNLPDAAGSYLSKTELAYNNNGFFRTYGQYGLLLTVQNSSGEQLGKVLTNLRSLAVKTASDTDRVGKAIDLLMLVNANAGTRREAENNIKVILQAIDEVRKLSFDAPALRIEFDELLKVWEKKWYLLELKK